MDNLETPSTKTRKISLIQKKWVLSCFVPDKLTLNDNLTLRLVVGKEQINSNEENSIENEASIWVLKEYFLNQPSFHIRKPKNNSLSWETTIRLKLALQTLKKVDI